MSGAPGIGSEDNGDADGGGTMDEAGAPYGPGSSLGLAARTPVLSSLSAV